MVNRSNCFNEIALFQIMSSLSDDRSLPVNPVNRQVQVQILPLFTRCHSRIIHLETFR